MTSTNTLSAPSVPAPPAVADVREMLRHIPARPDYDTWTRIIAAVGAALPLAEAAHTLNEWSPEERRGEYVEKLRHRLPNVGIGTLVRMAKQGGYDAKEAARQRHGAANHWAGHVRFNVKPTTPARPAVTPPTAPQSPQTRSQPSRQADSATANARPATAIKWPKDMHAGDGNELYALAELRDIPGIAGLEAATVAGHLYFASMPDANGIEGANATGWVRGGRLAWFLTDSARRICLARRLDGEPWCHTQQKAWMRKGSDGAWPIGAPDIGDAHTVGLTEGGPDFLCLWHLIVTEGAEGWAPVGMPSACDIAPDVLHYFRNKAVLIFPHNDGGAGRKALDKWAKQLRGAGTLSVRIFDFSRYYDTSVMRAPKDLNDHVRAFVNGTLTAPPDATNAPPASAPPALTAHAVETRASAIGAQNPDASPTPFITPSATPPHVQTAGDATPAYCPQCRTRNIVATIGGPTCAHTPPAKPFTT